MKKIIHFETLGCRLNQDETEGAARAFLRCGFIADMEAVTAAAQENIDVLLCIVNTCTVTGKAEQKARRIIRLLLEKYPESIVIVTGCYAEVEGNSIRAIDPNRIAILRGTKKYLLTEISSKLSGSPEFYTENGYLSLSALNGYIDKVQGDDRFEVLRNSKFSLSEDLNPFSLYTPVFEKHSRGSLKVQDGCNCACSFCRIHLARGKSVSLFANEVVRRVKEMEQSGVSEVVFTGVNLSQYSSVDSFGNHVNLAGLLSLVLANTSKIAVRVSSLYPQSVDGELCEVLSDARIQPFFHLSIQSGSDRILELMRRPHSVENVFKSIELIRQAKADPFISCDLIAGFPGEIEDDFELTKELCDRSGFAWIHAFPFSPRPGTPAFSMKGQVPERVKGERVRWLTEKAVSGKISYIEGWKGKNVSAVVENSRSLRNSPEKNIIHAVTENYLHVECPVKNSSDYVPGTSIRVQIENPCTDSIVSGKEIDCTGIVLV